MPPLMTPQTGPAKRGPKMATAAQGNYLANQAARRPTVTPTTPPGKPNPFSASGPGTTPSPSTGGGMSASGVSSIPAASAPGASASPSSLGTVPMASATMKRGGRVQKFAAGGTTETNQYGNWGGANAANAVTGTAAPTSNYNSTTLSTPGSGGPFNTNPSGGGYIPGAYRAAGDVIGGTNPTTGAWNNTGLYSATGTPVNTSSDQYLSGANFSSQPNTPAPMWPIGGGQYSPTPGNGGKGYTWRKGGSVKRYAAGGTTETNQYGSWGGANAANATTTGAPASTYSGSNYAQLQGAGLFSTTAGQSPLGGSTSAAPNYYAGMVAGNGDNPQYNINQGGYLMGSAPGGAESGEVGGSFYTARGGSIPAPKEEPYRNKWKAKNHPGDSSYRFDDGGDVPDPGGVDMSQGQEGQAGDLSGALGQVQQAYQYGLQQVAGNIPTVPAGPGGDQTQGGGPQDRGQQMAAADQRPIPPAPGGAPPQGVLQPTPKPFNPRDFLPGQQQSDASQYTASAARGGSIPSYQGGGPAMPTGGGVGGSQPPKLMRYLSGADSAPVPQVLQRQKSIDPSLPPTARTVHTIASAGGPQQQYQALQAFRRLSDNAATHAKVSLTGNGKQPASLPHAVMFANKKFEYQPTPYHVSFALKGKGKSTQKVAAGGLISSGSSPYYGIPVPGSPDYIAYLQAHHMAYDAPAGSPNPGTPSPGGGSDDSAPSAARGGIIQSFDDGGDVGLDVDMSSSGSGDTDPDPISQMAGAGAPITMNVSDLQTGQTQSQDITPAQLQSLASGSFDSYVAHPTETLSQAVERAQANAEAGGVNEPIQQSQGSVGQRIGNFIPSAIKNAGQSNQANAPGEADISGTIEPDWSQVKRTGLAPGPEATTGDQGAAAAGTSPGQPAPGEGPMSPFNLPVANKDRTAVPVGKVTSSALPPATEPINNTRDIPGTEIDKNGVRRVTDPQAYDDFRNGRTNFDFNTTPSEQGAKPYSSSAGTPQTELEQQAAPPSGATPNAVRYGMGETNGASRNAIIAAGQENLQQMNQDYARNRAAEERERERERANQSRPQPTGRGQAARRAPAARQTVRPGRARVPRRVYGRGHAGLGTYQEMANGQSQYLGPQDLTGSFPSTG